MSGLASYYTDEQLDFSSIPCFNYQKDGGSSKGYAVVRLSRAGYLYATDLATLMFGIHRCNARSEARKVDLTIFLFAFT